MPDIAARADAAYFDWARIVCAAIPGGETHDDGELLLASSGTRVAAFNIAFVTQPLADPPAAVRRACDFFDRRGLPFVVRIREGFDPRAERALEQAGLPYADTVPGMALSPIPPVSPRPAGLEIRTLRPGDPLDDYVDIIGAAFGMPAAFVRVFCAPAFLERDDTRFYLGLLDGVPCATSAFMRTGDAATVANIAVRDAHRRRGLGEAITWHAVREGADLGCDIAVLQASDMGQPVYERMGFRVVSPYRTFHRPGQPSGW